MQERHDGGSEPNVPLWLVAVLVVGFIFGGLGSFPILDNNEGLYAEIAREMLAGRDWQSWIIPHLNGLPYMEKPPLLYWLTALSFAVFDASEWSARLVPALSALACAAMLFGFGNVVQRPMVGRLAAVMFVSCLGVTAMSHVLMFDMLLTACLTAALMEAWRYVVDDAADGGPKHVRRAYAFLALAVLAKGLAALALFGLIVVAFTAWDTRSPAGFMRAMVKWFEPWAWGIFLAIAAPWHIVAGMVEPIFAWFYFINEHVLRFLGRREPHDYYAGAWWYYLPRMAIYLFPWSFLLLGMIHSQVSVPPQDVGYVRLKRFLWAAWLMPLLFFSLSSAKANYYLIAVMPFIVFHLALALAERDCLTPRRLAIPAWAIAVLALAVFAVVMMRMEEATQASLWGWSRRTLVLALSGGAAAIALATASGRRGAIIGYLALATLMPVAFGTVLSVMEPLVSTCQTAQYLQRELPRHTVYLYRNFEEQSSLPFYLKTPLPVVDARSNDLFWGNKLRKNDILISSAQFAQRASRQRVAIVVMRRQLKDFKESAFFPLLPGEKCIGDSTVFFN